MARHIRYDEVRATGGVVVAPDGRVAEVGAGLLRAGGNAVDAAVGAAFAVGVVEPFNSGIGGGTWITIGWPDPERYAVVEGPIVAPLGARPDMYEIRTDSPPGGWKVPFYDWPPVVGHANVVGATSVAVPGSVAALCEAHRQYGRLPLAEVTAPAAALADDGCDVSWFLSATIVSQARGLRRDKGCAEIYLPRGLPLRGPSVNPPDRLRQPALAETLRAVGAGGAAAFYSGRVAKSIVGTVADGGGRLSLADLDGFRASTTESPSRVPYGPFTITGPLVTGVPTVVQALHLFDRTSMGDQSPGQAVAWARALKLAFADRFRYVSPDPEADVPWDALLSPERADQLLAGEGSAEVPVPAGQSGNTTHVSVVDGEGVMVSLTQTVLNLFGAHVLDPETGVVLNNGMGYFDPRPGRVTSVKPGIPGLGAVAPVVLSDGNGPAAAIGSSGGRRIVAGVAQMIAGLARGEESLQTIIERPRIHAESNLVLLDARWPDGGADGLRSAGFDVEVIEEQPTTVHFACPNGIVLGPDGTRVAGVDPNKVGAVAAAG